MKGELRTAVLLYGFLRTAEITSKSLLDNVVDANNADIFYFGPDSSDKPTSIHKGILDGSGFVKINPKNDAIEVPGGIEERLNSIYGDRLKLFKLHDRKFSDFEAESSFIDMHEWLFSLNPARFVSMFYNMQGVFSLMEQSEKESGLKYDRVILTRPDLSFYSRVDLKNIREGFVYMPSGEGFCPHTGNRNYGLSPVMPYRNKSTGKMVETGFGFNDQVMVFGRNSSQNIASIYESALQYMREKIPLTPETILYYHLVSHCGLKIKYSDVWPYEIVRSDESQITTLTDLMILDIIDRYHAVVKERARNRPFKYFLKFNYIKLKALKRKFIR